MPRLTTILHPTDFSQRAELALQLACALAHDYNARLIVLHVRDAPAQAGAGGSDDEATAENLADLCERYPQAHMELRMVHGDPTTEILHAAGEASCDVIVMGTHGRSGVGRLLLGSVAEEVLRRAECPVLTVRDAPADAHLSGELIGEAVSRAQGGRDA